MLNPHARAATPIPQAFRALIPLHFYCEGGVSAGCPTIVAPDSVTQVPTLYDRSAYVDSTYELSYAAIWPSIGYMAIFVGVFQALNILSEQHFACAFAARPRHASSSPAPPPHPGTYRVRHISR